MQDIYTGLLRDFADAEGLDPEALCATEEIEIAGLSLALAFDGDETFGDLVYACGLGAVQAERIPSDGHPNTEGFPYQLQVPVLSSEEERNVGRVGERQRIVHGIPGGRGRGHGQCLRLLAGGPLGCIITGLSGGVVGRAARIHGFWTARGGVRCGGRREQEWMAQAEGSDPHDQPSK